MLKRQLLRIVTPACFLYLNVLGRRSRRACAFFCDSGTDSPGLNSYPAQHTGRRDAIPGEYSPGIGISCPLDNGETFWL